MFLTCATSVWLTKQKYPYDISNQPLYYLFLQSFLSYVNCVTFVEYELVEWFVFIFRVDEDDRSYKTAGILLLLFKKVEFLERAQKCIQNDTDIILMPFTSAHKLKS